MATESAVPANLYAYSNTCVPAENDLRTWVLKTLAPAVDAYVRGATARSGGSAEGTIDISAVTSLLYGGRYRDGSLTGDLADVLSRAQATDREVHRVGQAFEFAGGPAGGSVLLSGPPPQDIFHLLKPDQVHVMDDGLLAILDQYQNGRYPTPQLTPTQLAEIQRIAAFSNDAALRDQANRALMALQLSTLKTDRQTANANPDLKLPQYIMVGVGRGAHMAPNPKYVAARQRLDDIQQKIDEISGPHGLMAALAVGGGSVPHYLLSYDTDGPRGHAIISAGDPYAAGTRNVITGVFGMTSEVKAMDGDVIRDDLIFGGANAANPGSPTAVVTWYGYTAPRKLSLTGPKDVLFTAEGRQGGVALAQFQQQLVDLKQGPPAHMTVVAHSYGGEVTGFAAMQPGGLHAQDVIFLGSVGTPPEGLAAMSKSGAHIWTARYSNDVARDTTFLGKVESAISGIPGANVTDWLFHEDLTTQLADPNAMPGITHLTTGPGLDSASKTHSHYWEDPIAMRNITAIGAGLPPPPITNGVEPPDFWNIPNPLS